MRFAYVVAVLAMFSSDVSGQTRAELRACFGDAVKLCAATSDDPSFLERLRIRFCMIAHRDDVSPPCKAVFKAHGL